VDEKLLKIGKNMPRNFSSQIELKKMDTWMVAADVQVAVGFGMQLISLQLLPLITELATRVTRQKVAPHEKKWSRNLILFIFPNSSASELICTPVIVLQCCDKMSTAKCLTVKMSNYKL
jgi:hypothetical protein